MCVACKVILDSAVIAVADETARLVASGEVGEEQVNDLIELDAIYIAALPLIVRDKRSVGDALNAAVRAQSALRMSPT